MSNLTRWQRADLSVWPTFGRLFNLRDGLDQLFESSFGGSQLFRVWNPAVDIFEDADNVIVKSELPGLKKEDIDVSLDDGTLSISGERKDEREIKDAQTHRSERFVGSFLRTVTLPSPVKNDQVKAQYQDGILTVTLPKAEEAKRKQIEVKVN